MRALRIFMGVLGIAGLVSGCAVSGQKQAVGMEYPVERVVSVRPGMSEAEVIKLLGRSYAREQDPDGTVALRYEYQVTSVETFAGGVGLVGVTGTQRVSGGKTRILLDPDTRAVKAVQYEIQGAELYKQLKGGNREKTQ